MATGAVSCFAISGAADVWSVEVLVDSRPAPAQQAMVEDTVARIVAGIGGPSPRITWRPVEDEDWVARSQAALPALQAGRFIIHGSHDQARFRGRALAIEINAGLAFGTGHHGTTEGCLLALDGILRRTMPRRVLDLGCGSGILAIAAAKVLKARVLAADIDPVAVNVAAGNVHANGVGHLVRVFCAEGLYHPALRSAAPFDLVLANILARPLVRLAPSLRRSVAIGGQIVLSGLLRHDERRIVAIYRLAGFRLVRRLRLGEWSTLVVRREGQRRCSGSPQTIR